MKNLKLILGLMKSIVVLMLITIILYAGYYFYNKYVYEKKILEQIVERLKADSRIAEVLVTNVVYYPASDTNTTTIKFLEFDSLGKPLAPKYFTFSGNIIQFQSLVVRFADSLVATGDPLRGKSVYLFWKAFVLNGANTKEYVITPINEIPQGYKIEGLSSLLEDGIWKNFWAYALNPKKAVSAGIKNA
ncbi:MAG: hypothetical protein NT079_03975, partial [Candidatus Omnitrophica bacterium]|nr:hypothetical protein [Candidatus Omnitrophota bacterium]